MYKSNSQPFSMQQKANARAAPATLLQQVYQPSASGKLSLQPLALVISPPAGATSIKSLNLLTP